MQGDNMGVLVTHGWKCIKKMVENLVPNTEFIADSVQVASE